MPVTELETLLACKMMAPLPDYSVAERRIGTGIVEHYNRKTGRCDPGVERLANLFEYDRRTVLRATTALCDSGLFSKTRHGGRMLRNSYEPNWEKFKELHDEWQKRFRGRSGPTEPLTEPSPNGGQPGPRTGGAAASQTCSAKLKEEPEACSDDLGKTTDAIVRGTACDGQARQGKGQIPALGNSYRPRPTASSEAALSAAHRRWEADLRRHCSGQIDLYGRIVLAIDDDLVASANEAEMRRRGAGLQLVLDAVQQAERWSPTTENA